MTTQDAENRWDGRVLEAIRAGDAKALRQAFEAGADPWRPTDSAGSLTPLRLCARLNAVACLKEALSAIKERGESDPASVDTAQGGVDALSEAARSGGLECAAALMEAGWGSGVMARAVAAQLARARGNKEVAELIGARRKRGVAPPAGAEEGAEEGEPVAAAPAVEAPSMEQQVVDERARWAIRRGLPKSLQDALNDGASPWASEGGLTLLALCSRLDGVECLRVMIKAIKSDSKEEQARARAAGQLGALHEAARSGSAACAKELLSAGWDPRAICPAGKTAWKWAIERGQSEAAEALRAGSNSAPMDWWWREEAKSKPKKSEPRRELVLSESQIKLAARVVEAIRQGDAKSLREALSEGASPWVSVESHLTPMTLCARLDAAECLRALIEAMRPEDRRREGSGRKKEGPGSGLALSAWHEAARSGGLACARVMIEAGWEVNQKGADGKTALDWADWFSHRELAELLKSHGALAKGEGKPSLFRRMAQRMAEKRDEHKEHKQRAKPDGFAEAARSAGQAKFRALANAGKGAQFEERVKASQKELRDLHCSAGSPMESACSTRKKGAKMVKALLSAGVEPRGVLVVSHEGCIEPLEICFRRGNWDTAGFLISELRERKIGPGGEALRWAMESASAMAKGGRAPSEKAALRLLRGFGGLNQGDSLEGLVGYKAKQPLLAFRAIPCESAVRALMKCGADPDEVVEEGKEKGSTALHRACSEISLGCVEALLAAGANPHLLDAAGRTALSVAKSAEEAMRAPGSRSSAVIDESVRKADEASAIQEALCEAMGLGGAPAARRILAGRRPAP